MNRILKVFRLARRIKRRHLKLGPTGILTISKNHLINIFAPKIGVIFAQRQKDEINWIVRKPSLSILLTVFNQSKEQLEASIQSARIQKGAEIKIVILDDGSTRKETVSFLNSLVANIHESVIRQENRGVISARNRLIDEATTDFLVFLDPDDEFDPDYISSAVRILEADRSVEIVYPEVLIHDELRNLFTVWNTGPFNVQTLSLVNTIPMSSVVSTRLMRALGGYSPDFETGPEDWDLWFRAVLSNARAVHLEQVGYKYTKAQVSRSSSLELNMSEHNEKILLRRFGAGAALPMNVTNEVQIFLLLPWLTKIGGVENYVRCLVEDLRVAGLKTAVIITEPDPFQYADDSTNYRTLGNIVLKRIDFPSDDLFTQALIRLAALNCISINFGAPWDFQNSKITEKVFSKQVCFIFNSDDSMRRAVEHHKKFDEFWVAFEGIKKVLPKRIARKSNTFFTGVIDGQMTLKESPNRSTFNVGFLGRFSPEKRPELFVDIAKIASQYKDIKFVMAGEGPMLTKVLEKTDDLTNFEYLGVVTNISDFFSQIDCLVISSETEGISLSAMEALSHGIPVLSTDVGGMRELLVDENQGFIWSGKPKDALPLLIQLAEKKKLGKAEISLPAKFWRKNTSAGVVARINELLA